MQMKKKFAHDITPPDKWQAFGKKLNSKDTVVTFTNWTSINLKKMFSIIFTKCNQYTVIVGISVTKWRSLPLFLYATTTDFSHELLTSSTSYLSVKTFCSSTESYYRNQLKIIFLINRMLSTATDNTMVNKAKERP